MHILIAPNAYKNSLSASDAATAIKQGLEESSLNCSCCLFPIADGGDGTGHLLTDLLSGRYVEAEVHDPIGRIIKVKYGIIEDGLTAVIDIATASGIKLLSSEEMQPSNTSTFGTGELIKDALGKGVKKLILGVGGSATVDAGAGILEALGVRLLDKKGNILNANPASLSSLTSIDLTNVDSRLKEVDITVLCDVNNTLLGTTGAARVFGPQKGASEEEVIFLESVLQRFNQVTLEALDIDMATVLHGGAAGGAAAALHSFFGAKLVNGIEHFLELTNFATELGRADLVITGEGSLDQQTLEGKGPYGVAKAARRENKPVIGLAGKISNAAIPSLQQHFDGLFPINYQMDSDKEVLARTAENLSRTAKQIGNLLSLMHNRN